MHLTKDHLPCKNSAMLGSKYCLFHTIEYKGFFYWLMAIGSMASILGVFLYFNDTKQLPSENNVKRAISNLSLEIQKLRGKINMQADGKFQGLDGYLKMLEKDISDGTILKTAEGDELLHTYEVMKKLYEELEKLDKIQTDDFGSLLRKIEEQKNYLAHIPAIRPAAGWITVRFGYRKSPYTGKMKFHKGMIFSNRRGTNIYATADGEIRFTGSKGMLGSMVEINHGHGFITRYSHLEKILCISGKKVQRGDIIATMGASGNIADADFYYDGQKTRASGALLYEVLLRGAPVNPSKYIIN